MSCNAPAPIRSALLFPNVLTGEHAYSPHLRSPLPRLLTPIESFGQTNQTWVLGEDNTLPSVVNNLRDVCAFASTIFGHAASADSELPSSTSTPTPSPTSTSNSGSHPEYSVQTIFMTIVILVSVLGL